MALLKILDDMNAPDYAFGKILEWARNAHQDKYTFYPQGGMGRATNIKALVDSMENAHQAATFSAASGCNCRREWSQGGCYCI